MIRKLLTLLLVFSLAASAAPVLPRAWQGARLLSGPRDTDAIAAYQLARLRTDDYAAEIDKALDAHDTDMAVSLIELAAGQGVALPAALLSQVEAAAQTDVLSSASDAWDGFLSGNAPNDYALGGAVAADLVGYTDVRDLSSEANNYLAGQPVDQVTVMFAATGLVLTVATVLTAGSALPAKAGMTTVKIARKLGRLSRGLMDDIATMARKAVNTDALADLGRMAKSFDLPGAKAAALRVVRPDAVAALRTLGDDVAAIGKKSGPRGALAALGKADNAADVSRMARLSQKYGRGFRAALLFTGSTALTLASVLLSVSGWLLGALIWLGGALLLTLRLIWWVARKFKPTTAGRLSAP